jgi:hypothetical protein
MGDIGLNRVDGGYREVPSFKGFCPFIPVQLDIIIQTFCDAVKRFLSLAKNASKPITTGISWIL